MIKLEEIALQPFTSLCRGPVSIYRGVYRKEMALCFSCFHKDSVKFLWQRRTDIADKVLMFGIAKWVILCLDGKAFYPPWQAETYSSKTMLQIANPTVSDGDIAKRILDSGLSCGVVDFNSNILLCASQEIAATIGRDAFAIQGRNLNDLWDQKILTDLNRDLKQQGKLEDFRYTAKSWVRKDGIWQTEEHEFCARSVEIVKFLGRWCRLTYGIEIADG